MHERGAILAAQVAKGALQSGATAKMLVRAANDSALHLATTLAVEASNAAPRKGFASRLNYVRQTLVEYQSSLWDWCDFRPLKLNSPAAEKALRAMLAEGEEDVRRELQRYEDGRVNGPPLSWPERHPTAAFWITTGIAGFGVVLAAIAIAAGAT